MDIIQILTAIKGKVLDVANFEILKKTYELQNENIEQLKSNNAALKESNDLLKERNNSLGTKIEELNRRITYLEHELSVRRDANHSQEISEFAEAILRKCIQDDKTEFVDEIMVTSLSPFKRVQAESGLDELINLGLVRQTSVSVMGSGAGYSLTHEGKKLALKISSKEKQ